MKSFYTSLLILSTLFIASYQTSKAQSTPVEMKTDSIARKIIRYFNMSLPDSIYALGGEEMKKQITPVLWKNIFDTQLISLIPFTSTEYVGSAESVNKYKLQGKQTVTFLVSLDEKGKIKTLLFQPYQEEVKASKMSAFEMKTDSLAQKVLWLINQKMADSAYVYAGNAFRSKIDKTTWKIICESSLFPLIPLSPAVFTGSKNGANQYKINQYLFSLGLDQENKFSTLLIQPYPQETVKSAKILSDNPMKTQLDSTINSVVMVYMQTKGSVGLSAGVSINGTDHFYNYGEVKTGSGQLPTNTSLYDIGSITKTFTSTLLAIAVDQKKVTLDSPVIKFLPDSVASNPALKNITLKMLANHTSGLPRLPENLGRSMTNVNQPYEQYGTGEMYTFLKHFTEIRKPGTVYEYSNLGAGLLGVILEKILQNPYKKLLEDYILIPAKLTQTSLVVPESNKKLIVQGYNDDGKPIDMWLFSALQGAGALKSSTTDLLAYGKLQLNTSTTQLAKAVRLTHQITFDDSKTIIGLAWHFLPENKMVIQHSGGTGGYRTFIGTHLQKKFAIAVLTNNTTTGDALGIKLLQAIENIQ